MIRMFSVGGRAAPWQKSEEWRNNQNIGNNQNSDRSYKDLDTKESESRLGMIRIKEGRRHRDGEAKPGDAPVSFRVLIIKFLVVCFQEVCTETEKWSLATPSLQLEIFWASFNSKDSGRLSFFFCFLSSGRHRDGETYLDSKQSEYWWKIIRILIPNNQNLDRKWSLAWERGRHRDGEAKPGDAGARAVARGHRAPRPDPYWRRHNLPKVNV